MWQDALRVCKEYLPHKLAQLQDEYDREMTSGKAGRYAPFPFFLVFILRLSLNLTGWVFTNFFQDCSL